jgi:Skp family chaperone for outer membrane proteins
MRYFHLWLAILGCAILLLGCGGGSSGSRSGAGHVAVVDLDEVAKRLGRDVSMSESVRSKEASLNGEIATYWAAREKQLSEKRKEFGNQPSDEQKKLLTGMEIQARSQLNQLRTKAAGAVNQHRADVIRQFREEVKAAAQKIAEKKSIDLVLTKNDTVVFLYQSVVDITDDVVARMLPASSPATAAAPSNTSRLVADGSEAK